MVSACMAAKWLFGENNVGRVIKEEPAHKMSKYKYQDGNGNLMLQKYQHYVKKYICTNKNLKKLNCISVRYISIQKYWNSYS